MGKIKAKKTEGGHRRYICTPPPVIPNNEEKQSIIYTRVSSAKQKSDLERQTQFLQSHFPNYTVIQDVGSGINFKRRGLLTLLDLVFAGKVQHVVVSYKDRLTRFGFDLFEHIFNRFHVPITVLFSEPSKEPTNELAKALQFSPQDTMDQGHTTVKTKKHPNKEQTILFNKCIGASRFFYT
ncbi:hypothetical protein DUNSADRAFT_15547 [Dunaliella salina]|uniref:Resolvase/invertase-type recombinase catalytic domain-containing protein n=1 Tax=Dunaliella salina TaxID=3046 RepID=A0ABQ7G593_DUNSA|nr:hypothetical protein DUNSADRAFT_15547 [Dunaliella salina]|eukprot:KAF5829765.1 hypothetical protein DUNSADRAFT_15547 [Dunaliella salina]